MLCFHSDQEACEIGAMCKPTVSIALPAYGDSLKPDITFQTNLAAVRYLMHALRILTPYLVLRDIHY